MVALPQNALMLVSQEVVGVLKGILTKWLSPFDVQVALNFVWATKYPKGSILFSRNAVVPSYTSKTLWNTCDAFPEQYKASLAKGKTAQGWVANEGWIRSIKQFNTSHNESHTLTQTQAIQRGGDRVHAGFDAINIVTLGQPASSERTPLSKVSKSGAEDIQTTMRNRAPETIAWTSAFVLAEISVRSPQNFLNSTCKIYMCRIKVSQKCFIYVTKKT